MKNKLYQKYAKYFGYNRLLERIINKFSNTSLDVHDDVELKKGNIFYGDVNIQGESSIKANNIFSGNIDIASRALIGSNNEFRENIDIASRALIGSNSEFRGNIDIGEHTGLNGDNVVLGDVNIGKYCAIAKRARIRTRDHPTTKPAMQMYFYESIESKLEHISKGSVNIGNDVWICSDVKILSDVNIGNGAVIAADSVVVDDVEPYSIVAGNPAVHKKYRFDKSTRDQLQEIEWWDWTREKQERNVEFFEADLREIEDINSVIEE